jgi:hypothetical protein
VYLNKPQAWSQPTEGEHELPIAGIAMRPELAGSGWFNSMIERGRQHEQHKKSAYMGKEEVRERFGSFRSWFRGNRTCTGEQEVQREGLMQR